VQGKAFLYGCRRRTKLRVLHSHVAVVEPVHTAQSEQRIWHTVDFYNQAAWKVSIPRGLQTSNFTRARVLQDGSTGTWCMREDGCCTRAWCLLLGVLCPYAGSMRHVHAYNIPGNAGSTFGLAQLQVLPLCGAQQACMLATPGHGQANLAAMVATPPDAADASMLHIMCKPVVTTQHTFTLTG
jgi:hypothetical protein